MLLLIFVISVTNAQKNISEIGIQPGINFSTIKYSDKYTDSIMNPLQRPKTGISAGVFVFHRLNPALAISSELTYSRKGSSYTNEPHREGKIQTNYINWASAGNIKIAGNRTYTIYADIGIYTAFWLNGNFSYTSFTTGETHSDAIQFKTTDYEYNRWDAGIKSGFMAKQNKGPWVLSLNYEHGMLESSKEVADSFRNRLISFTLGYGFIRK
jgi:hypothetical protein